MERRANAKLYEIWRKDFKAYCTNLHQHDPVNLIYILHLYLYLDVQLLILSLRNESIYVVHCIHLLNLVKFMSISYNCINDRHRVYTMGIFSVTPMLFYILLRFIVEDIWWRYFWMDGSIIHKIWSSPALTSNRLLSCYMWASTWLLLHFSSW